MPGRGDGARLACRLLPAALVVGLLPGLARAETLRFRNECPAPVVLQAVSVVRGVLSRDRPYLLNSGERTPPIRMPGNKVITIYDAKVPNRVLFQGAIPAGPMDQSFSILPGVPPPRVRLMPR